MGLARGRSERETHSGRGELASSEAGGGGEEEEGEEV